MKYLRSYKLFESTDSLETIQDILLSVTDEGFDVDIQEYPRIGMFEVKINTIDPIISNDVNHLISYLSEDGYRSFAGVRPGKYKTETIISLLKPNSLSDKLEKFFLDTLKSCNIKTSEDYPGDKFWINQDGTIVFRQDLKNRYFWCKSDLF